MRYTRRQTVSLGIAFASGVLFGGLGSSATCVRPRSRAPLVPTRDETSGLALVDLPPGFRYWSFGWTGDPLEDGAPMPPRVDGMGVLPAGDGTLLLVRNHEVPDPTGAFARGAPTYDPRAAGGTTTLRFDPAHALASDARATLCGTVNNCSGGVTPWMSWLSCEEDVRGGDRFAPGALRHGYVFEVPGHGSATAAPLRALGRFRHEAAVVDPGSGVVYETEDEPFAGLYRFVPHERGALASGRLEMLAARGDPAFDARRGVRAGQSFDVSWIPIDEPDPEEAQGAERVFAQGRARGGALFSRLEGACFTRGRLVFVSTDGGDACAGQVWSYDARSERLELLLVSTDPRTLDHPDNVAFHPERVAVICQDRGARTGMLALSPSGQLAPFCRNRVILDGERNGLRGDFTRSEFTGPAFDPTGRWLFANIQNPGFTLAITGPWDALASGW